MSRYLLVTWAGGGNLPPALGIARALHNHGQAVSFLGQEPQRSRIEAAGFAFNAFASRPEWGGPPPQTPTERQMRLIQNTWLNSGLADDVVALLDRQPADVVFVCSMLAGVLSRTEEFRARTAVLVPGLYASVLPRRDLMIAFGNQLRAQAGLPELKPAGMAWENKDLVVVTTLRELDGVSVDPQANVRYVGPVFDWPRGEDVPFPADAGDSRPLVLMSFSTMPGQSSVAMLQQALDALAEMPVRVLMTAGAVSADSLKAPANAAVYEIVPHSLILPHASVVVTHAGHGSVAAALAYGVPLVCKPSAGADQPIIAGRVEALGAGRAISSEATAEELRTAVEEVLAKPSYRSNAQRLAELIRREDGAVSGAAALEGLVPVTA